MRAFYITYWLLGFCSVFGHRWGYRPFWARNDGRDGGWYTMPSGMKEGRICAACAANEVRSFDG